MRGKKTKSNVKRTGNGSGKDKHESNRESTLKKANNKIKYKNLANGQEIVLRESKFPE